MHCSSCRIRPHSQSSSLTLFSRGGRRRRPVSSRTFWRPRSGSIREWNLERYVRSVRNSGDDIYLLLTDCLFRRRFTRAASLGRSLSSGWCSWFLLLGLLLSVGSLSLVLWGICHLSIHLGGGAASCGRLVVALFVYFVLDKVKHFYRLETKLNCIITF